jgi:hydroxymethylpyrimidine pyrophosphatase-like HAD family hydrolase
MKLTLLFSDLDGTCVHYQDGNDVFCADSEWSAIRLSDGRRTAVLTLPPTSSGARGMISVKTLELFAAVRALGTKLVLISGCRYSTLLERLPFLPAADAYV